MNQNKKILQNYIKNKFADKFDRNKTVEYFLLKKIISGGYDSDTIENFLNDVTTSLSGGYISELIYTEDILKFYAKFEKNIWEIVENYLEDTGLKFSEIVTKLNGEEFCCDAFKTHLCFVAVEVAAVRLLGIINNN